MHDQPATYLLQSLKQDNIIKSNGLITFNLAGITVKVEDVSVVGNILQEWLGHYMTSKKIYWRSKQNTQEFPDFLLDKDNSDRSNLLEVKSFKGSPNFDIANFSAYARSLRDNAYRLDAKYLIFKYSLSKNERHVVIEDIWLKNVWEICGGSERSPVKIQWKQSVPVNIRPSTWYSDRSQFGSFTSRIEFVEALNKVIGMAGIDRSIQNNWLKTVSENYKMHTGNYL